jgi:hypothetical protein
VIEWLRSLAGRLVLALFAAALGISALQYFAVRCEAEARAPIASPAPKAVGLGIRLSPAAGTILLATRLQALAPDVAPVVQVFADGSVALRRPALLSTEPTSTPRKSRDGHGAAILLPGRSLAGLTPHARGALLEVVGQLVAERPVAAQRFAAGDVALSAIELQTLLQWVP